MAKNWWRKLMVKNILASFFGEEYTVEFEQLPFLVLLVFSLYLENAPINYICAVREIVK